MIITVMKTTHYLAFILVLSQLTFGSSMIRNVRAVQPPAVQPPIRVNGSTTFPFIRSDDAEIQSFSVTPQNAAAVVKNNATVTFQCKSNTDRMFMLWSKQILTQKHGSRMTAGNAVLPTLAILGFQLILTDDVFDLVVPVSTVDTAMMYTCTSLHPAQLKRSAFLVVLESDPECTSNVEPHHVLSVGTAIKIRCYVRHYGDMLAYVACSSAMETKYMDIPANGSSSVVFVASLGLSNTQIECVTSFNAPPDMPGRFSADQQLATNRPNYSHLWVSTPFNVTSMGGITLAVGVGVSVGVIGMIAIAALIGAGIVYKKRNKGEDEENLPAAVAATGRH